jgi:hypothetical protein
MSATRGDSGHKVIVMVVVSVHTKNANGEGVDIQFPSFLMLVPHRGSWSGSCPCCYTYGESNLVTNEQRLGGSQGQ